MVYERAIEAILWSDRLRSSRIRCTRIRRRAAWDVSNSRAGARARRAKRRYGALLEFYLAMAALAVAICIIPNDDRREAAAFRALRGLLLRFQLTLISAGEVAHKAARAL